MIAASVAAAILAGAWFGTRYAPTPTPTRVARTASPEERGGVVHRVRISVVVDNYVCSPQLREAWGVSMYVEADGHAILFDTGPDPSTLKSNARVLGVDLSRVEAVVLSHEHGDHVGGIEAVAEVKRGIPVYIPSGSDPGLFERVRSLGLVPVAVNASGTTVIPGVVIVGPLMGPPPEQGLALVTPRGVVLLVGCSHPGVVNLVREAERVTGRRVVAVIGGFHLFAAPEGAVRKVVDELISEGVEKIYPIHCSGDLIRSILASEHPEVYGDGCAGKVIVFNASTT